jgi:hypothetical protein
MAPAKPPNPTVDCDECHGDGVVERLIPSSLYYDSPDYREETCESCDGTGSESCEWCGEPACVDPSDMSKNAVGAGATVCSWTCKALVLDGPEKVGREVDAYRKILASARNELDAAYLATVAGRQP